MKAALYKILLPGLLTILLLPVNAQNISYTTSGGLKLGFGLGASYQTSDIKNSEGVGWDIRLGTPIYKQENAFFALDWRFRFLNGYNRAYDHRVNFDGGYNNIQLTHFNYDLELALTLNRLRERTRIILSGFIGAGIMHGITSTDLLDASNNAYDYASILPNRDPDEILSDLDQLTDKDFETRQLNRAAILPTAGIYLGYEFTPHFALGVEYKMNLSLSEHNSTFGIDIDNRVLAESFLDLNNYTSVGFRWALGGRSSRKGSISAPAPQPLPTVVAYPPQVDITDPYTNPYVSSESSVKVTARIFNIARKEDISVRLNGQNQDFLFYSSINRIEVNANLRMGSNSLEILCQNEAGSDSDDLILHYRIPSVKNLPELKFINPSPGIQVEQNRYPVQIQSRNIAAKEDVILSVNGKRVYNFDYDGNGIISLDLDLNEGLNEIKVSGRNPDGTAEDMTNITYVKSEQGFPPEVKFLRPIAPQSNNFESTAEILAEISNVESQRGISFRINGINTNDYSFDPATKRLIAAVPLISSTTRINISAQNRFGSDSDSRVIFKESQPVEILPCPKPVISFSVTESGTYLLRGTVRNIQNKGDILLSVNGIQYNNWRFTPFYGEIQADFNFDPGTHTIDINAANECGSDRESKTIVVEAPCLKPVVRMNISEVSAENATHLMSAELQNVSIRENITVIVNSTPLTDFRFNPASGQVTAILNLDPGSHSILIIGMNECGSNRDSKTIVIEAPCALPSVSFNISEVNAPNATHQLRGRIQNLKNKSQVTLTVNGRPDNGFQFVPRTGELSTRYRFNPGSYTIVVSADNECGSDSESKQVQVTEIQEDEPGAEINTNPDAGWVRINPGNASWEFCLQTPRGNYNRDNLSNPDFSYSGNASSLYFKPIAGGGTAIVNGKTINLNPGQYYLFRGNLKVQVTNKRQGSMGNWSLYIESGTEPSTGRGNNRPESLCETGNSNKNR